MKSLSSLLLIALVGPASAALESAAQSTDFSVNNQSGLYNGSGSQNLANPGFFTATCQPFNASLGTLTKFTVDWQIGGSIACTVGTEGDGGSASGSLGGTFFFDGIGFGGTGNGNGGSSASGDPLDVGFAIPNFHYEFPVEKAGVTYHPGILSAVTGSNPFPVAFNSAVTVSYSNVVDLEASVDGTMTLTYTFDTAAGSESLKIVNLIHNGVQQTVSIEWTSAAGKTYAIDASSDLSANSWAEIQAGVPASTGAATTTFVEQNIPATVNRRFYRVREEE